MLILSSYESLKGVIFSSKKIKVRPDADELDKTRRVHDVLNLVKRISEQIFLCFSKWAWS